MSEKELDSRHKGNEAFKEGKFLEADQFYSQALEKIEKNENSEIPSEEKEKLKAEKELLYSNKAAALLRLGKWVEAKENTEKALFLNPGNVKALYRGAQAMVKLGESKASLQNLSRLLQIEPNNNDALTLTREVRNIVLHEKNNSSPITEIMASYDKKEITIEEAIKSLQSLCNDDKSHAIDFGRKKGVVWLGNLILQTLIDPVDKSSLLKLFMQFLASLCLHQEFVKSFVDVNNPPEIEKKSLLLDEKFCFQSFCLNLAANCSNSLSVSNPVLHSAILVIMNILKQIPLTINDNEVRDDDSLTLYLNEKSGKTVIRALNFSLIKNDSDLFSISSEALTAFISEAPEYLNSPKIVDSRLESLEERKKRLHHSQRASVAALLTKGCSLNI